MTAKSDTDAGAASLRWGLAPPFGALLRNWLRISAVVLIGAVYAARSSQLTTEAHFFWRQDAPVFVAFVALTAALGWAPPAWLARTGIRLREPYAAYAAGLALLVLAIGAAGVPLVFGGYTLSLDEFMANFDARIFSGGQMMAPIDDAWQPFAPALQPMYTLPVPDQNFWISAYLPVNAAMRALGSLAGVEWLVNPLLSAISVVAIYAVARRLWPERPGMALAAAALLATSAQFVVTAMTAYAMPGHLAFNLVWLWLFLRGGRLGHVGAILVGFLASGLHQMLFHPLFAAPFVLQLWLDRRWRLAAAYTFAYALICGFWVEYWNLELRLMGQAAEDARALGGGWMIDRIADQLGKIRFDNLGLMAESLVRLLTWQSPLTAPLVVAGAIAAERARGHLRALVVGVLLTFLAMLVLIPTQTHGWGYRYAHGLLGSLCLIAVWTWTRLTDDLAPRSREAANAALAISCAVSLVVFTPIRIWQAWAYVRPYATANAVIQHASAPVVIIDHEGSPGFDPGTVVRNDPYLRQGPKVMELSYMDPDMLRQVCARYPGGVEVFTGADAKALGVDTVDLPPEPKIAPLRALMAQLHCGRPIEVR